MAFPACDGGAGISPGSRKVLASLCQILSPLPEVARHCCPYSWSVAPPWSQGSGERERQNSIQMPPQSALDTLLNNFLICLIDPIMFA